MFLILIKKKKILFIVVHVKLLTNSINSSIILFYLIIFCYCCCCCCYLLLLSIMIFLQMKIVYITYTVIVYLFIFSFGNIHSVMEAQHYFTLGFVCCSSMCFMSCFCTQQNNEYFHLVVCIPNGHLILKKKDFLFHFFSNLLFSIQTLIIWTIFNENVHINLFPKHFVDELFN